MSTRFITSDKNVDQLHQQKATFQKTKTKQLTNKKIQSNIASKLNKFLRQCHSDTPQALTYVQLLRCSTCCLTTHTNVMHKILFIKSPNFKPKNHQFTILPHFLKIDVTSEPLDQFSWFFHQKYVKRLYFTIKISIYTQLAQILLHR